MMETQPTNNYKQELKALKILFYAMLAGVVMLAIVLFGLSYTSGIQPIDPSTGNILKYIVIAVAVIALIAGRISYNKGLEPVRNLTGPLTQKLSIYRSVLIRYLAISEGAALFSLIAFYLTGDHRLFLMTGIMLAAMLWAAPTTERIIATLNPDWQEQQDLR